MARRGNLLFRINKTTTRPSSMDPERTLTTFTEYGLREDGALIKREKINDHDYGWSEVFPRVKTSARAAALVERRKSLDKLVAEKGYAVS